MSDVKKAFRCWKESIARPYPDLMDLFPETAFEAGYRHRDSEVRPVITEWQKEWEGYGEDAPSYRSTCSKEREELRNRKS